MIDDLIDKGDAYYAFDQTNELDELRKASEKSGETFIYNWENRMNFKNSLTLSKDESKSYIDKGDYVIRYKTYDEKQGSEITVSDEIRGNIKIN